MYIKNPSIAVASKDLSVVKIHKIKIPAKNVTNCVFGGSENNEIFISTAR